LQVVEVLRRKNGADTPGKNFCTMMQILPYGGGKAVINGKFSACTAT
jgi:hypothetical protein